MNCTIIVDSPLHIIDPTITTSESDPAKLKRNLVHLAAVANGTDIEFRSVLAKIDERDKAKKEEDKLVVMHKSCSV